MRWIVLDVLEVLASEIGSIDVDIDPTGAWVADIDVVLVELRTIREGVLVHWTGHAWVFENAGVVAEPVSDAVLVDILAVVR